MYRINTNQSRIMRFSLVVVFLLAMSMCAQAEIVEFDSGRWTLVNADTSEYLGRKCLSGIAYLEDVEFTNGIIEVDMAVEAPCIHTRSYPGIVFRKQSPGDYERFYIRPHRSGLYTDALQYTPVFNNIAGWQLYNGEGATAGIDSLPANRWFRVKAEISGKQCKIYIDNADDPALVISDLKHGISTGSIGVFGPPNVPVYFSNFQYTTDENLQFEPPPEIITPYGMITEWELSQPFPASEIDFEQPPDKQGLTELTWQSIKSAPSGMVDIARYTGRTSRAGDCIWARTTIHADRDEVREYQFGYSDAVSVFLNNQILFSGTSAYQQRDPSFLGIVGLFDAVYLPLNQGDNELLLLIAESFGGWGFMGRDADAVWQHQSLTKTWEHQRKFKFPESVVYDKERDVLYVSNYFNEGNEFISKVKLNGEIDSLQWVTGLSRPTGLSLFRDTLYAVDRQNLIAIDPESGEIINKYPIPEPRFLNDLAFDSAGNGYISDAQGNKIYKFAGGVFEVWLQGEEVDDPNGLHVKGDKLLWGNSGDGCLKSVGLADKNINTIVCLGRESIMDGIQPDGHGNYLISDYNGRLFLVTPSGEKTELLNTTAPGILCADFAYIIEKNLLIVPTLFENRLTAYTYTGVR
ncbi:SMP-30/gluconolactonase/LRE family protein [Candidatus Zixiibacteriota bacterium]